MEMMDRLSSWIRGMWDSQSEAVEDTGIDKGLISNYWNKKGSKPGAEILAKFLEQGCDINWLLSGGSNPNEKLSRIVKELRGDLKQAKRERDGAIGTLRNIKKLIEESIAEIQSIPPP